MIGTNVGQIYYNVTLDTAEMVRKSREVDRATESLAARFNAVTSAVKILAAAMALLKAAQVADDMRLLAARVQVAAGSIERGAVALDELRKISARTQTELASNAAVFARLNASLMQMGGTQDDTLQITELVGKAIKVSGASAAEASSALLQFGQALGSGKLAGDELRSLLENAPYLMRQLADGLGVPIGSLKQLGEEGKLTADVVVNALRRASEQIDADFKRLPQTLSAAMSTASDAAARLVAATDEASGASAALAGVAKGAGEALDQLARGFEETNRQATGLGRNDLVRTWADATRLALSYVADAADVVWQTLSVLGRNVSFVFGSVGREVGGIAAQVAAVARGDFSAARAIGVEMRADADRRRRELDAADAESLRKRKTWGEAMRDTWRQASVEDRGFTPAAGGSTLRSPRSGDEQKQRGRFDAEAYIAGLEEKTKEGVERINLIEQEALRKNADILKQGKITREQAAQAATLIETHAANERSAIWLNEAEKRRKLIEDEARREREIRERQAQEAARGQEFARGVLGSADPALALELELQKKSQLLSEFAAKDQANLDFYAQARVALEQQTQQRLTELIQGEQQKRTQAQAAMLSNYGSLFGSLADITKTFAGEQSGLYKGMFAVSKAFAIADSIIKIQQGIANALALPFPANIGAAASTAAAASGLVATIAGTNFGGGRQYGGRTLADTMYRVNESGRPEMFVADNGAQYMLPTRDGRVEPNAGGSAAPTIELRVVNMHPTATVQQRTGDDGRPELVVAEVASQITERRGPVWRALSGSTNVRGAN